MKLIPPLLDENRLLKQELSPDFLLLLGVALLVLLQLDLVLLNEGPQLFLAEVSDNVLLHVVFDFYRTHSEPQRANGEVELGVTRVDAEDYTGSGVSPKWTS